MSILPWILSVMFALLAAVGWQKVLNNDDKQQISEQDRKQLVRDIVSQKEFLPQSASLPEQEALDVQTVQACMSDPEVQKKVETKARLWAEEISNQVLEEYKEEEQKKEEKQVSQYMDTMEDFFLNSVNTYSEEYELEPEVSEELHQLVEYGFEKQRELYRQKIEEGLSPQEYRRLRDEAKAEDKQAIVELLGQEGAKDFGALLREEGARAKREFSESSK
ncbi:MAG: hypothetical protein CMK59_14315 [Proteobacteria bacterium]|nr:hypothetical protein [Pseudomonadota bacterium]